MRTLMLGLLAACTGSDKESPATNDTGATAADDTGLAVGEVASALSASVHEGVGSILVATWTQGEAATTWLEFSVDEGEWLASPATARETGAAEELALGLPFDAEVQVRVAWDGGSTEAITAQTGEAPSGLPEVTAVSGDPEQWDTAMPYVLLSLSGSNSSVDGQWSIIVDRQGRPVWAKKANTARVSLQTQLGYHGDSILIDQSSFWAIFDGGSASTIERVNIEGAVTESFDVPGQHHPFTELPDGSIAWGAVQGYFNDDVVKTISPDGTEQTLWSCLDFLDDEAAGGGPDAYCGSNTLSYSAERNSLLFSLFSLETMVEIDADTGETLRYFGHVGDNVWSFDPEESAFWWQHGGHFTSSGTMLVSTKGVDGASETILREYTLDEDSAVLTEILTIGEGEGIYGDTMGEADYTPGGHILHNLGSAVRVREYTLDGTVVWDVAWGGDMLGRTSPVADLYALR